MLWLRALQAQNFGGWLALPAVCFDNCWVFLRGFYGFLVFFAFLPQKWLECLWEHPTVMPESHFLIARKETAGTGKWAKALWPSKLFGFKWPEAFLKRKGGLLYLRSFECFF